MANERLYTWWMIRRLVLRAGAGPFFAAAVIAGGAQAQEAKPVEPTKQAPEASKPPAKAVPPTTAAPATTVRPAGNPKATPIVTTGAQPGAAPIVQGAGQPAGAKPTGAQPPVTPPAGTQPSGVPLAGDGAAAGAAPADGAAAPVNPLLTSDPDMITLSAFSEPVQLSALVNLVATTLGINVTIIDSLDGAVAFNAAVPVKKSELLRLLDALLEQHGWTITLDDTIGWYTVRKIGDIPVNFQGQIVTTKIFSTPNLRPTAVTQAISGQLGGGGGFQAQPGQPGIPGGGGAGKLQPIDELGIIIATDTPRKLLVIGELITKILEEWKKAEFIRLELTNVAAPTARDRVLQLLGQAPQGRGGGDPNQAAQFQAQQRAALGGQGSAGALDNIGDRLTVDPLSNALIFRGLPGEIEQVKGILAVIDVQGKLKPKRFFAGSAAVQIADMARQRGLGEVTTISNPNNQVNNPNFNQQPQFQPNRAAFGAVGGGSDSLVGGPVMVVDEANGTIIYYGTDVQQEQLALLIEQLDTGAERIVIREYKLKNSDAVDVTDVINGLLYNQSPVGSSDLLGDSSSGFGGGFSGGFGSPSGLSGTGLSRSGGFGGSRFQNDANRARRVGNTLSNIVNPNAPTAPMGIGEGLELDPNNAFVIADVKNNQILVKAPAGAQKDFAKLIEKLDLRRPQVYLECKIIAVSMSDDMRLAVETQLINAAGLGGLLQTNFGLTTAGNSITDRRNVATGLQGLTAALLENKYVPIVINALQTKTEARILSSPSLLVDDNEEATIATVEQEPYTTTQTSVGNNNISGFGGYAEAGTTLLIKPHISEDGYLRLQYKAELSSFTGAASNGNPPPKQTNTVESDNITVPGDSTVIVGGINIDTNRKTKVQVPLLGDIPFVGHLFMDYNRTGRHTTLYIFVTPRILREPTFADLRLLTLGPQAASKLAPDVPPLQPVAIDINTETLTQLGESKPPPAPLFQLKQRTEPAGGTAPAAGEQAPAPPSEAADTTSPPQPPAEQTPPAQPAETPHR